MEKQTLQIRVGGIEYCDSAEQDFLEALLQIAETYGIPLTKGNVLIVLE
jgi:hypothetical protein